MKMKNAVRLLINAVVAISLCGFVLSCGGGGDDSGGSSSGQSGSITLAADTTDLPADGSSSATITATIKDSAGNPVRHYTEVVFTTNLGHFRDGGSRYTMSTQPPLGADGFPDPDASPTGIAEAALIAATNAGTAHVTVTSNGVTQSVKIEMTGGLVSSITLKASVGSVSSDNSDNTTITATVLDSSNAVLKDTTVTFTATDGSLGAPSVVTDEKGEAAVTFACGNQNNSNRVSTITARSGSASWQILIYITGTTLDPQTDYNNLEIGSSNDKATLTITAADAGGNRIVNALIAASVEPSSTGDVTLTPLSGYTDVKGELQVEVTAKEKGDVIVKAEGLGTTATQTYTVGIVGEAFTIISPEADPYSLPKGTDLTVVVRAPSQNQVIFATTCGTWDGGTSPVVTKPVENQQVSAVLNSSEACYATVQVYDADNSATTDSLKVNIYPPSDSAARIDLQASSYVVAISSGGVFNSVALEGTVRDDTFQIVPNVPVSFSIADSTGGGEYVAPPLAYTKAGTGKAEATFTSGSMSSGTRGVTVNATVVGKPAVTDSVSIVIGGTAGSVVIGQSTSIESINNDTTYKLPMTAQVVDSNGNPVPGARISLQLWPKYYRTGVWIPLKIDNTDCIPEITNEYPNEDDTFPGTLFYRNLILDPGEDRNGDGQLTPASSAAGSVPADVVADDTGVASFDMIYPKSSAVWIMAELTGSTLVLGSETRSTTEFALPYLNEDAKACALPDSPYNKSEPVMSLTVTATPEKILPDDGVSTSSIRATVTQLGSPVPNGTLVSFAITSGLGFFMGGKSEITATTTAGQAGVDYYSGDRPGDVVITATLADGTSVEAKVTLTRGAGEVFNIAADAPLPYTLSADGSSMSFLRAVVSDDEGYPVFDGTDINFAISGTSVGSGGLTPTGVEFPPVNEITTTTTAGIVSAVFHAGNIPGEVTIWISGNKQLVEPTNVEVVKITLVEVIGSMTLVPDPDTIPADGSSSSAITATILDIGGEPVAKGTTVVFVTNLGDFYAFDTKDNTITVTTPDDTGVVTVSLISAITPGTAFVTATATVDDGTTVSTVSDSTSVVFSVPTTSVTVTANPLNIVGDNADTTTITATVSSETGPVSGVSVGFSKADTPAAPAVLATTLSENSATTNASGQASITLTGAVAGSTVVTATYGSNTGTVTISIAAP